MFQIQNEDKWSVNLNLTRRGAEVEGVWLTAYSIGTAVRASADLKWSSDLVFQHGRTNSRQPVCDWLWIQHPDLVFKYCSLYCGHPDIRVRKFWHQVLGGGWRLIRGLLYVQVSFNFSAIVSSIIFVKLLRSCCKWRVVNESMYGSSHDNDTHTT